MEDSFKNERKLVLVDIPQRTIPTTSLLSETAVKIVKTVIIAIIYFKSFFNFWYPVGFRRGIILIFNFFLVIKILN